MNTIQKRNILQEPTTSRALSGYLGVALIATSIALTIIGILSACSIGGLAQFHSVWYAWNSAAAIIFVVSLVCMCKGRCSPQIQHSNSSFPQPSSSLEPNARSIPHVIEIPPSPPESREWDLQWEAFCKCQPELLSVDLTLLEPIDLFTLLKWVPPKKQAFFKEKLQEIQMLGNSMPAVMKPLLWLAEQFAGMTSKEFQLNYRNIMLDLKKIIYFTQKKEKEGKDITLLKKIIIEKLADAFKECSPTWGRVARNLCDMCSLKDMSLLRSEENVEEKRLQMIIFSAVESYKEEAISTARQLRDPKIKDKEWHYISYLAHRVGSQIGIKERLDIGREGHAKSAYNNEGKTDEDLIQWFKGICVADSLVDFIKLQIDLGIIEYKTDDGEYIFPPFFRSHLILSGNQSEEEALKPFFDENYKPNRQGIAFILLQFGIISVHQYSG